MCHLTGNSASGPTYTGIRFSMGRAAVLDTDRATILASVLAHEPWDLGVFTGPVFEPLSRAVIECASRGLTSSDYTLFPFRHVQRPIYPLDNDVAASRA